MGLRTPEKVEKLRKALHAKAKDEPEFRFYQLYDKLYRDDVLAHAYRLCRANGGAGGVDGVDFETVESGGLESWLGELRQQLREKSYRADPVRRVWLDKPDGGRRPLGIPTIRDRVVQTAAVLVLEPIFEADLPTELYAYRANRSALDAVRQVHGLVSRGYTEVVDADLSDYFGTIPHAELMRCVARRISDRHLLALVKQWLVVPVEEVDGRGRRQRSARAKREKRGIPQGAPVSPLLANLYMRRLVLGWKQLGHERQLNARLVVYADDFVICCRGSAAQALQQIRSIVSRLKLELNESKTGLRRLPGDSVDFVGYTIGRCYSVKTGRAYIGTRPSKKSIRRANRAVHEATSRQTLGQDAGTIVKGLNRLLVGWSNYFCLGPVTPAYRALDLHARSRLLQWLRIKHGRTRRSGVGRYTDSYLYHTLGLVCLPRRTRNLPWAKA